VNTIAQQLTSEMISDIFSSMLIIIPVAAVICFLIWYVLIPISILSELKTIRTLIAKHAPGISPAAAPEAPERQIRVVPRRGTQPGAPAPRA
jgi:hypothetical protein